MEKNHVRIKIGLAALGIVFIALVGRLFYIQVLCHEEFAETAQVQYEITVEGMDTRGKIFDRNMKPLTGGSERYYYIIKTAAETEQSSALFGEVEAEKIGHDGSKYQVYRTGVYDSEVNEKLRKDYGCYVFSSQSRYEDSQAACHLIGYLNDSEKKGVSGLEYLYEERLAASANRLVLMADAAGNILHGMAPEIRGAEQTAPINNSLVTTIDINLQQKCESLLAGSAACIVSDAYSGEILAMASSPGFNPNRIPDYLTEESDCLINKTLQSSYPPGSVFKLVVAAAALESSEGAAARTFECAGRAAVGGVEISCATAPDGGHGSIDMYEAMAKSCNCYFAQLGEETGYEKILLMARKLGFGKHVLPNFPEESEGNIPSAAETGSWDISNISIGQGTILATPLQVSRMVSIIANDGREVEMKVVLEEAEAASGYIPVNSAEFNTAAPEVASETSGLQLISEITAHTLQDMMRGVMTYGTCSYVDWQMPVWGKSGTAEASLRGQPAKNCWLIGFCDISGGHAAEAGPVPNVGGTFSRYVIAVFVEDGISGSATALPIFKEVADYLKNNTD